MSNSVLKWGTLGGQLIGNGGGVFFMFTLRNHTSLLSGRDGLSVRKSHEVTHSVLQLQRERALFDSTQGAFTMMEVWLSMGKSVSPRCVDRIVPICAEICLHAHTLTDTLLHHRGLYKLFKLFFVESNNQSTAIVYWCS